jgi:hypothetical protein
MESLGAREITFLRPEARHCEYQNIIKEDLAVITKQAALDLW